MESAGLAKDIAAFANSKDGGVLVIGKCEKADGNFSATGLNESQAGSFDTTKVATWINNRFAPPIDLVCRIHDFQGKRFVIITISEFSDIPHLCVKSFQDPANPKKHLLKEGTVYVRTKNADSSPISSVEELRTLIGLATKKRGHELLSMFNAMLSGAPLLQRKSANEYYGEEFNGVEEDLGQSYQKP